MIVSPFRPSLVLLGILMTSAGTPAPGQQTLATFDTASAGQPPPGFSFAAMRQPSPGAFVVRRTPTGGHVVHAADAAATGFTLALAPGEALSDLTVSVRMRLTGGSRTGGVVWRYVDARNVRDSAPLATHRGILLAVPPLEPGTVMGDHGRLLDAVTNVVVNAIYYNVDGGRVRIALDAGPDTAVVHVADTGVGIAADALPRIFEPFFRADPARSRPGVPASAWPSPWRSSNGTAAGSRAPANPVAAPRW